MNITMDADSTPQEVRNEFVTVLRRRAEIFRHQSALTSKTVEQREMIAAASALEFSADFFEEIQFVRENVP